MVVKRMSASEDLNKTRHLNEFIMEEAAHAKSRKLDLPSQAPTASHQLGCCRGQRCPNRDSQPRMPRKRTLISGRGFLGLPQWGISIKASSLEALSEPSAIHQKFDSEV